MSELLDSCDMYDDRNTMNWVDVFNGFEQKYRHKLFIGNLAWETTEEELKAAFKKTNIQVIAIAIFEDAANGCSIGFCCVGFASEKCLAAAREEVPKLELKSTKLTFHEFTSSNLVALCVDAQKKGRIRYVDPKEIEDDEDRKLNTNKQDDNAQDVSGPRMFLSPCPENWSWRPPAHFCAHPRWRARSSWPFFHNFSKQTPRYFPPPESLYHQRHLHHAVFRVPPPWISSVPNDSPARACNEWPNGREFDDILRKNKAISSAAIQQSVTLALDGETRTAMQVLMGAIASIKDSEISEDDRCRILLDGLRDTLRTVKEQDEEFYEYNQRSYHGRRKRDSCESSCHHERMESKQKRHEHRNSSSSSSRTSCEFAEVIEKKRDKAKHVLTRKSKH